MKKLPLKTPELSKTNSKPTKAKIKKASEPVKDSTMEPAESKKPIAVSIFSLPIKEQLEYHNRVSAFALYTSATIKERTSYASIMDTTFAVKADKHPEEHLESDIYLNAGILDFKIESKDIEDIGKIMFAYVFDKWRSKLLPNVKMLTITSIYGDKYSFKGGIARVYTAKTKTWEDFSKITKKSK